MKTDEEILKEFEWNYKFHKSRDNLPEGVTDFKNLKIIFSHHNEQIKEAIALTRQDCEKKFMEDYSKFKDQDWTLVFKEGQKAERERIWQILKKLYQPRFAFKVMNATQGKQESDDWFRGYNDAIKSELKIEEELKKEIMKDDRT